MKVTVAMYKNVKHECVSVNEVLNWIETGPDYVRISEPVDVEFTERDRVAVVEQQVAALEAAAADIEAKAFDAVANIKARIMELRSIGHEVQS